VSVGDSGIGIDTADQERIFRPFEQAGDAAAHPRSGTGLGLSISRELIQHHGGTLWVESAVPGAGSLFRFRIPVRAESGRAACGGGVETQA